MKSWIRGVLVALAVAALTGGSASQVALAQSKPKAAERREAHPVLQRAIRQLEGVKDELQKAPDDFHGHKEAAVDAVTHALSELHQAEQADRK
jgi:hypothetical protein